MNSNVDRTLMDNELSRIHDPVVKKMARTMLDRCPDAFWTVAASSTGKYHPRYARERYGLVFHSKAVFHIAGYLLDMLDHVPLLDRDCLLAAALIHDSYKHKDGCKHTNFEHPLTAADTLRELYDTEVRPSMTAEEQATYDYAIGVMTYAIATHMGRFNTNRYEPETVLPKPDYVIAHTIVHIADYLASRTELHLDFLLEEMQALKALKGAKESSV